MDTDKKGIFTEGNEENKERRRRRSGLDFGLRRVSLILGRRAGFQQLETCVTQKLCRFEPSFPGEDVLQKVTRKGEEEGQPQMNTDGHR